MTRLRISSTSSQVRKRVEAARALQQDRFLGSPYMANAEMGPAEVWGFCPAEDRARGLLREAMKQLNLSARAFHRILKPSRTIADLSGIELITVAHVAEALQYRYRGMG